MSKITYRIKQSLALLYWWLFKPRTRGARLLNIHNNWVLLVRPHHSSFHYLPGGLINRNETFSGGLTREIREELGTTIRKFKQFGVYTNIKEGKRDFVKIFLLTDRLNLQTIPSDSEIAEAAYFPIRKLPASASVGTRRRIQEYLTKKFPVSGEW